MGLGGLMSPAKNADSTQLPTEVSTGKGLGGFLSTAGPTRQEPNSLRSEDAAAVAGPAPSFSLGGMVKDMAEGVAAPFIGDWHAARAILADPAIHILPVGIQDEEAKKAQEMGWKGAATWGSMLAAGATGGMSAVTPAIIRSAVAGGVGMGTYEAIKDLPEVFHGKLTPEQSIKDIGTMAAVGVPFGLIPGGAKLGVKAAGGTGRFIMSAANKAIDAAGAGWIRDRVTNTISTSFANVWDKAFTSGIDVLKKAGLGALGDQLHGARTTASLMGGKWVANHVADFKGLSRDQVRQVASIMEKFASGEIPEAGVYDMRLMTIAEKEANRLRDVGRLFEQHGVQVYDPEKGLHVFVPRKDFAFPRRFVNPSAYREGSEYYDAALKVVAKAKPELDLEGQKIWLSNFADRIQNELDGITVEGKPVGSTSGSYLKGRQMNLPGFSTDIDQVLPQYYEHAARRLTNHIFFGKVTPVGEAAEKTATAVLKEDNAAVQAAKSGLPAEETPMSPEQTVFLRSLRAQGETRAKQSIEFRYPRAFAQLETVENPALKALSENILRRQLGAIDRPSAGLSSFLDKAQYLEVITKLALGAIAQPSQMFSAVAKTGFKGAVGNFVRAMGRDPETLDFATRAGVILKGVVQQSEQSLTGKETQFLSKVGFTQMDLKSRIFGALQGATFAEHQANKFASLAAKSRTPMITRQMAMIEKRLQDIGIDPQAIIKQGGSLTEDQLLRAANSVAHQVNFWGDALSLPEFWKSPGGRYLTQFKSFSFQQSKLFKDHFVKPALNGDWGPITRFALLTPAGGEIISNIKSTIRGTGARRQALSLPDRLLEDFANGAGFGLTYDAFNATKYGAGGVAGFMFGPSLGGTIPKTATAVGEAIRGKPENLARISIQTGLPLAASVVAPRILPVVAAAAPALSNALVPRKQ